jgi:hypothetical protein
LCANTDFILIFQLVTLLKWGFCAKSAPKASVFDNGGCPFFYTFFNKACEAARIKGLRMCKKMGTFWQKVCEGAVGGGWRMCKKMGTPTTKLQYFCW